MFQELYYSVYLILYIINRTSSRRLQESKHQTTENNIKRFKNLR